MDNIRENLFGILVGALSLGLVAFAYFWVFSGLSVLGEDGVQGDINVQLRTLRVYTQGEHLPSKELHERLEQQQKAIMRALESGKQFYAAIKTDFDQFFPSQPSDPELIVPADFKPLYTDKINELTAAYIEAFPQAAPPENLEEFRSSRKRASQFTGVKIDTMDVTTLEEVQRAMKEYWVSKHVCDVLHTLNIGGLKEIDFPGRAVVDENAPEHYKAVKAMITLDMPFQQILPLLAALYSRPQVDESNPEASPESVPAVPFYELEEITVTRKQETVIVPIIVEKLPGEDTEPVNGDAAPEPDEPLRDPAPDVSVTLKLWALDWRGLKEREKSTGKTGDEDD